VTELQTLTEPQTLTGVRNPLTKRTLMQPLPMQPLRAQPLMPTPVRQPPVMRTSLTPLMAQPLADLAPLLQVLESQSPRVACS